MTDGRYSSRLGIDLIGMDYAERFKGREADLIEFVRNLGLTWCATEYILSNMFEIQFLLFGPGHAVLENTIVEGWGENFGELGGRLSDCYLPLSMITGKLEWRRHAGY